MSILIRDMEMPKNCDECPLIAEADDYDVCYINEQFIPWEWVDEHSAEQRHPKPSWCPLVELPPHGDLIDRNALGNEIENERLGGYWGESWRELRQIIVDAPTIIEAESEE